MNTLKIEHPETGVFYFSSPYKKTADAGTAIFGVEKKAGIRWFDDRMYDGLLRMVSYGTDGEPRTQKKYMNVRKTPSGANNKKDIIQLGASPCYDNRIDRITVLQSHVPLDIPAFKGNTI